MSRGRKATRVVERPLIRASIGEKPHWILISRGDRVNDDFWYGLSLRLHAAPSPDHSRRLQVPVDRFLGGRLWLRDHCVNHDVGIEFDSKVRALLENAGTEAEFVQEMLQSGRVPAPKVTPPDLGPRFARSLRTFQRRDLEHLLALPNGANFSVPGAGKTAVTYALYEAERQAGRVSRLLVVAPLSAFEAWEEEARECFARVPQVHSFDGGIPWDAEVVLVNYQKLKDPHFETLVAWARSAPTHIVLDEAHRMKRGQHGEWGRACLRLAHVGSRRDILTGTPAPNSPRDLIALIDFVWPGQASVVLPASALQPSPLPGSMELVSRSIKPFFVRTTKKELELTPPSVKTERVPMGSLQADIYNALRNRYAGAVTLTRDDRTDLARMGEITMFLLEGATNPGLLARRPAAQGLAPLQYPSLAIPPASSLGELIQNYGRYEVPEKFKRVALMVAENSGARRKTLVWSNFIGNLLALERVLAPYQPALVYGAIPSVGAEVDDGTRTRQREILRFRSDPDCTVLLANPAALGEGVSLHHSCNDAIYVDRTFNAGQYLQSLDRIHRLGLPQDAEIRITILESSGSIDELVATRLEEKTRRLSTMLDDPDLVTMALPDDEEFGPVLEDREDLLAVLEHLRDE